jgi:catechol 2,3-dioxygenase-like lactoylglutathione lyase family enzyme
MSADEPGAGDQVTGAPPAVRFISALTLATEDMGRAVRFYRSLGFPLRYGSEQAGFTSFALGKGSLNLTAERPPGERSWWGRVIFYVDDVDAFYGRALAHGLAPEAPPRDAEWGERYFHILDPDGHELSFASPL